MPDRPASIDPDPVAADLEPAPGRAIRWASWIGTSVFVITAVPTAIAPNTFIAVGVATSLAMFFAGIVLFFWAYAVAVNRSRTDLIGMGGLFFLAGSAPRSVQRSLLGSLAVQVVVGLVTAAVHPFTPLAFGVLAWMYGLALCGLWAARYGTFPPRPPDEKRGRRGARTKAKSGGGDAPSGPRPSGRTTPKGSTAKRSTKSSGRLATTTAKPGRSTKGAGGSKTKGSKAKGSSSKSSYL